MHPRVHQGQAPGHLILFPDSRFSTPGGALEDKGLPGNCVSNPKPFLPQGRRGKALSPVLRATLQRSQGALQAPRSRREDPGSLSGEGAGLSIPRLRPLSPPSSLSPGSGASPQGRYHVAHPMGPAAWTPVPTTRDQGNRPKGPSPQPRESLPRDPPGAPSPPPGRHPLPGDKGQTPSAVRQRRRSRDAACAQTLRGSRARSKATHACLPAARGPHHNRDAVLLQRGLVVGHLTHAHHGGGPVLLQVLAGREEGDAAGWGTPRPSMGQKGGAQRESPAAQGPAGVGQLFLMLLGRVSLGSPCGRQSDPPTCVTTEAMQVWSSGGSPGKARPSH